MLSISAVVLASAFCICVRASGQGLSLSQANPEIDNNDSNHHHRSTSWFPSPNEFSSLSFPELKNRFRFEFNNNNFALSPNPQLSSRVADHLEDLGPSFDARKRWPHCPTIGLIRRQGNCSSCWAFAGAGVLSDAFCIQRGINVELSPQTLVSCDEMELNPGCAGGKRILGTEWVFMNRTGIPPEGCFPYVSSQGHVPDCPEFCQNETTPSPPKREEVSYHSSGFEHFVTGDGGVDVEQKIMQSIFTNGPVQATFDLYEDFLTYGGGVYRHVSGRAIGGHSVKVVGWGVNPDNVKYWIGVNQWGKNWGVDGTFLMLRGQNECRFEQFIVAGYAGEGPPQ